MGDLPLKNSLVDLRWFQDFYDWYYQYCGSHENSFTLVVHIGPYLPSNAHSKLPSFSAFHNKA